MGRLDAVGGFQTRNIGHGAHVTGAAQPNKQRRDHSICCVHPHQCTSLEPLRSRVGERGPLSRSEYTSFAGHDHGGASGLKPFDEYLKLESESEYKQSDQWSVYAMSRGSPSTDVNCRRCSCPSTTATVAFTPRIRCSTSRPRSTRPMRMRASYTARSSLMARGTRTEKPRRGDYQSKSSWKCSRNPRSDVIETSASCCFSSLNPLTNTFSSPRRSD